jgi:hypothetical protein
MLIAIQLRVIRYVEREWLIVAVYDAGCRVSANDLAFGFAVKGCADLERVADRAALNSCYVMTNLCRVRVIHAIANFRDAGIDLTLDARLTIALLRLNMVLLLIFQNVRSGLVKKILPVRSLTRKSECLF